MKFPKIGDIATRNVVSIDRSESVSDAIKVMFENEHRNIIVVDDNKFYILTVTDVLNIKIKNIDLNSSLMAIELSRVQTVHKDKCVTDS